MEKKKNESPKMETELDRAIRDYEVDGDTSKFGYKINGREDPYDNYLSNNRWKSFLNEMPDNYLQHFMNGSGDEIEEKNGRWGLTPPKMASFGSSSRLIYELSKDTEGFIFEEQLDTRVGGIANLDGFLHKGNEYIYVEAKRREIYYRTHENEKIKSVYIPVYDKIQNTCGHSVFWYKSKEIKTKNIEDVKGFTFYINETIVEYFDLKQLICHFLGITYDLAKHNVKNAKVKFLYLIYNPHQIKEFINDRYCKNILKRYDVVANFIKNNIHVIGDIFSAVLQYQIETHKLEKPQIIFEFKLVDQNDYQSELTDIK